MCTEHCKQLQKTTAVIMFKVSNPSPLSVQGKGVPDGYTTKKIECSLEEVKMLREEILRIQEAL